MCQTNSVQFWVLTDLTISSNILSLSLMDTNEEIIKKLDTLIKVNVISAIQGKNLKEQVRLLSLANLAPKDIAEILRKSPNHISVILNDLKKEKKYGSK